MSYLRILLVIGLLSISCLKNEAAVELKVNVKNSAGQPVSGALIRVNDEEIGYANDAGEFSGEVSVPLGTKVNIEISKQSDSYYYAPFYDSINIPSEGIAQLEPVKATLYFVPKPTAGDAAKIEKEIAEKSARPAEVKPAEPSEVKEVAAEPVKEVLDDTAPIAKLPAQTIVEKNDETPPSKVGTDIDSPASSGIEEPIAANPTSPQDLSQAQMSHQNNGASIFTIHAFSADQPIKGATVLVGETGQPSLKVGCTTNERGRCVLRYKSIPETPVTIVVSKDNYQTLTKTLRIKHLAQERFDLTRGDTIDIFAITKTYNYTRGVAGVDVWIQGKQVGKTDSFGHLYYVYSGKKSDLVEVQLRTQNFIPEDYVTDFVVAGPMSLVRYFSPTKAPPVKMTVLKIQPAGKIGASDTSAFDGFVDKQLAMSTDKYLFDSHAFTKFPLQQFRAAADKQDLTLSSMIRKGWDTSDIKASLDVVLLPTLVVGTPTVLELSVINSHGQVLSAAKETLDNSKDAAAIDAAVAAIAKSIGRSFPFEGAVLAIDTNTATINLGFGSGRALKVGDEVEVYGVQTEEYGRKQAHKNIATLTVKSIADDTSQCQIKKLAPRSVIHRGDLVVLRVQKSSEQAALAQIKVLGSDDGVQSNPVSQANVYFNDRWIGATDGTGKLAVTSKDATGSGYLKVIKHGYRDFAREISFTSKLNLELNLERELAFLRIESNPSGALVRIEGKDLGKTPLAAPMAVPSGFVKLEVVGPQGYKNYQTVLDLDEGTIELTDANKIELQKDYRLEAQSLLKAGKTEEALTKLREVPATHQDFLLAAHDRGEIYLTRLKKPVLAAKAFSKVTSDPMVKNFNDKRFIGSHVDEGIALFQVAESLQKSEPSASTAHYQKALETLENVAPYLRFVAKGQYARAVNNVEYYKALSQHRLWNQTKNPSYLNGAYKSWRSFLDSNQAGSSEDKAFAENARIYLRQTESSLALLNGTSTTNN